MTFTIKCNACGKETVFSQGRTNFLKRIDANNKDVEVYNSGYDGEITIECVCGAEVHAEY
jgi:ssDNA-binding Zn-finger/Zn-ribbon topoisomerase 1